MFQTAFWFFNQYSLEQACIRASQQPWTNIYVSLTLDGLHRVWAGDGKQARQEEDEGFVVLRILPLLPREFCVCCPRESDFSDARLGLWNRLCWQLGEPEYGR